MRHTIQRARGIDNIHCTVDEASPLEGWVMTRPLASDMRQRNAVRSYTARSESTAGAQPAAASHRQPLLIAYPGKPSTARQPSKALGILHLSHPPPQTSLPGCDEPESKLLSGSAWYQLFLYPKYSMLRVRLPWGGCTHSAKSAHYILPPIAPHPVHTGF